MDTTTYPADLAAALVAACAAVETIGKAKTVNAGKLSYRYADLADVLDAVRPALAANQLAVLQPVTTLDTGAVAVTTMIVHAGGATASFGPLVMPWTGTPQAMGSAITYARRYSLLSVLGLAPDDDDGQAAAAHATPPRQERAPRPATPDGERVDAHRLAGLVNTCQTRGLDFPAIVHAATDGRTNDPHQLLMSDLPAVMRAVANAGQGPTEHQPAPPPPPAAPKDGGQSPAHRKMYAALRGVTGLTQDDWLPWLGAAIGRPVTTSKDMTADEIAQAISVAADVEQGTATITPNPDGPWTLEYLR